MKSKIVPPNSADAERGVLGCILLDNKTIPVAMDCIYLEDFYEYRNRVILESVYKIYNCGQPIDLITLIDTIKKDDLLEKAGGVTYISALTESAPVASHIETYCKIVKQKSQLRAVINKSMEITDRAREQIGLDDVDNFIEQSSVGLIECLRGDSYVKDVSFSESLGQAVHNINILSENDGMIGIRSGLPDLDRMTGGFKPQDYVIIAGRPGMGKTTLALNFVDDMVLKQQQSVAFFSLEMNKTQLAQKLILIRADIMVKRGHPLGVDDYKRINNAANMWIRNKDRIEIYDRPMTPKRIVSQARTHRAKKGLDCVVVDYLQLLKMEGYGDNRQQEVADLSTFFKLFAKEFNIPVILLSQLNRQVEYRSGRRPSLSDLRDTGAIEQDADYVIFTWEEESEKGKSFPPKHTITLAKQRMGPVGDIEVIFDKPKSKFLSTLKEPRDIPYIQE